MKINKKYLDFFNSFKTCGLLAGGRNTGKSFFGATLCLLNARDGSCNSFAMRRESKTAERDTASLIIAVAKLLFGDQEWEKEWQYKISYNQIINRKTGKSIICRGIGRNIENLKSFGDIQFVWVDEATNFSQDEVATLIPSIEDRWQSSKLLFTSNIPPNKRHWIFNIFLSEKRKNKDYKGLLTSFRDNPYVDQDNVFKTLSALNPHGSSAYLREVEGIIPDFSNQYLINDFEVERINKQFYQVDFLFSMSAGDVSILAISYEKNLKCFYVLGELRIENGKNIFEPLKAFCNEIYDNFHLKKPHSQPRLFVKKKHFNLLYGLFFRSLEGLSVNSVVKNFDLKDLTIFNYPNLNLKVDTSCFNFLKELELAEWNVKEDQEEFKVENIYNLEKLNFLKALTLIKGILNE